MSTTDLSPTVDAAEAAGATGAERAVFSSPGRAPSTDAVVRWLRVCELSDLEVERGRAALLDDAQVALFLLVDGTVRAVANLDPFSGAQVISRGIVGSRGAATTIASPMYKQIFDLRTGHCLDAQGKDPAHLRVWPVRIEGEDVMLGLEA